MTTDRRELLALTGAFLAGAAGCTSNDDTEDNGSNGNGDDGTDTGGGDGAGNGDESDEDSAFDDDAPDFPDIDPVTDPDLDSALLAEQVRGNVAFSISLLEQLREDEPDENLFFSPYSLSVALAMTRAGARGDTATEMDEALRYNLDDEDVHAAFGSLEDEFERRNDDGESVESPDWMDDERGGEDDLGYQLSSANAVWTEENYPFDEAYLDLLETYYEAGEHLVDFTGSPDEAREEINEWVAARTNDRIEDLLSEGSVDETTRLVLTNAVYFLAAWEYDFDQSATEPKPFTSLDGSETEIDMMSQREELRYAEVEGHQLVELPYANGDTSMVVILPAEGEFETFEDAFTVDRLAIMLEEAFRPQVTLSFPKFGIESEFSLVETMHELGMEQAFGGGADFSGMVEGDDGGLFIDDIVHQSFVAVDEEGTEAAAATAVETAVSEPSDYVEMTVDRPFLFYIRDRPTETPLFVGRVIDGETLQSE
ncbi:serpin family protein [Natrialbaceae archaeon A-arb3/5]